MPCLSESYKARRAGNLRGCLASADVSQFVFAERLAQRRVGGLDRLRFRSLALFGACQQAEASNCTKPPSLPWNANRDYLAAAWRINTQVWGSRSPFPPLFQVSRFSNGQDSGSPGPDLTRVGRRISFSLFLRMRWNLLSGSMCFCVCVCARVLLLKCFSSIKHEKESSEKQQNAQRGLEKVIPPPAYPVCLLHDAARRLAGVTIVDAEESVCQLLGPFTTATFPVLSCPVLSCLIHHSAHRRPRSTSQSNPPPV